MSSIYDFDFTRSIRDFDFTRRAIHNMNGILDSKYFSTMDTEMIFNFLYDQIEIISFKDYLKRYIYQKAEITEPFVAISDNVYRDIIMESFQANQAPRSFEPSAKRWSATVKNWLNQSSVKRSTILLLGFGLKMTQEEVSEFLTKVLQEEDLDLNDERECVFWHCYYKGLSYEKALDLIEAGRKTKEAAGDSLWESMRATPHMYLGDEKNLILYLGALRERKISVERQDAAYCAFVELYRQVQVIIAELFNNSYEPDEIREYRPDDITPGDVEKILCSGVPLMENGNLQKISSSLLAKQFSYKRMSRQRIHEILEHKRAVERFDLITLLFYIYAETVEPDWPTERYMQYIDRINEILSGLHMMEIYPVNPYEAFVLMCLLTEEPLLSYADVWEMSYRY